MIVFSTGVVFDQSKDGHDEVGWDEREKGNGAYYKWDDDIELTESEHLEEG